MEIYFWEIDFLYNLFVKKTLQDLFFHEKRDVLCYNQKARL